VTGARRLGRAIPLVVVGASLVALIQFGHRLTETSARAMGASDPVLQLAVLGAGIVLLGSGALVIAAGVLSRAGAFAMLAGLAWLGPELARFAVGAPMLRSAMVAAGLLVLPLLIHLVLVARGPGHARPVARGAVLTVDALVAAAALAIFLSYSPFYDPLCPEACNYLTAVVKLGLAERSLVAQAARLTTVASGVLLIVVAVGGLLDRRGSSLPQRVLLAAAVTAGTGGAGYALVHLSSTVSGAGPTTDDIAWLTLALTCVGLTAVAVGMSLVVGRYLRTRYRISAITQSLATAARLDSLESELARALDDAELRVGYAVDEDGALVGTEGAPLDLAPAPGRMITPLERADAVLAVVAHRDDIDPPVLIEAFRPSLLVALDNDRLRALRLAQLRDLRQSRARIVELGDAERRRVERDLHDGAQQGLLAVAFDLRLARATAEREGRPEAAILHAHAEELALSIVEDLRRLCRGIHPQVLSQAGLGPALASLAEESEIPLEIAMDMTERAPLAVETAAYELILDALAQAVSRGSDMLGVSVGRLDHDLVVEATDGSAEPLRVLQRAADRIGAVGGVLSARIDEDRGSLRAVLPCA
jgi:signal transduction histidine kinase